jgi:hypothetical protein
MAGQANLSAFEVEDTPCTTTMFDSFSCRLQETTCLNLETPLSDTVVDDYFEKLKEKYVKMRDRNDFCIFSSTMIHDNIELHNSIYGRTRHVGIEEKLLLNTMLFCSKFSRIMNNKIIGHYWLYEVFVPERIIWVYDPLERRGDRVQDIETVTLKALLCNFFGHGYNNFDVIVIKDRALQQNGIDCGVYVCEFARRRANGMEVMSLTQADIPQIRKDIIDTIREGKFVSTISSGQVKHIYCN